MYHNPQAKPLDFQEMWYLPCMIGSSRTSTPAQGASVKGAT